MLANGKQYGMCCMQVCLLEAQLCFDQCYWAVDTNAVLSSDRGAYTEPFNAFTHKPVCLTQ